MNARSVNLRGVLAVSAGILLTGCGTSIRDVPLNVPSGPMAPRSPESVEVFMTQRPSRPYTEVSILEAQQQSQYSVDNTEKIMAKMREYAAQKGCDGIIVNGSDDSTVGAASVNGGTGSGFVTTLKGYRATCIVYTGSPPAVTQTPQTPPQTPPSTL